MLPFFCIPRGKLQILRWGSKERPVTVVVRPKSSSEPAGEIRGREWVVGIQVYSRRANYPALPPYEDAVLMMLYVVQELEE